MRRNNNFTFSISALLRIYAERKRLDVDRQPCVFMLKKNAVSSASSPQLFDARATLPVRFQGEEIFAVALEYSPGFDWQLLSQKMRNGGRRAVKRIYYLGW